MYFNINLLVLQVIYYYYSICIGIFKFIFLLFIYFLILMLNYCCTLYSHNSTTKPRPMTLIPIINNVYPTHGVTYKLC